MYNAHWIHSLPYSKFIELTLYRLTLSTQYCKKKFYLPQTLGIFIVITATLFFLFEVCGYCILISAGYCVDKCLGIELEFQEEAF